MASPYPQQQIPNGWQIAGQAVQQGGNLLEKMQDMIQKRQAAILAAKQAEDEAKRAEEEEARRRWEFEQKQAAEKRADGFVKKIQDGRPNPSAHLARPQAMPYGDKTAEIRELENVEGLNMPTQSVGGSDPNALLANGLDRTFTETSPYSDDEALLEALYSRQISPKEYYSIKRGGAAGRSPMLVQEFEFAKSNGYEGSFEDYVQSKKRLPSSVEEFGFSQMTPAYMEFLASKAARTARASEGGKIDAQIEGAEPLRKAKGEISPQEKKQEGASQILGVTSKLRENYSKLRDMGGIVDTEAGSINNVIAKGKSSAVGQWFQKAVGTDAQSIRNEIKTLRTFGLLAIKNAADLGTTSMNTAAEMKIFLDLATDPDADFQANLAALEMFEQMYAQNIYNVSPSATDSAPKPPSSKKDKAIQSGKQLNLGNGIKVKRVE